MLERGGRDIGRHSGRYRKNEEDKAQPIPLKLHKDHRDKLDFVKGKNTADKIRYLLDSHIEFRQREGRQIKELKIRLRPLSELARSLYSPETRENKDKSTKTKEIFLEKLSNFKALVDLFHFEYSTIKQYLTPDEIVDLDIIFYMKEVIDAS